MAFTRELFPVNESGAYGYRILNDGKPFIVQPSLPAVSGDVFMDEALAGRVADAVIAKLSDARTDAEDTAFRALITRSVAGERLSGADMETLRTLGAKGNPTLTTDEVETLVAGGG